jgi:hypothetical protein
MTTKRKTKVKAATKLLGPRRQGRREAGHRELLDHCLQAVQGWLLRFHVVSEAISRGSRAAKLMEETLDRADEELADVRDRARALAP